MGFYGTYEAIPTGEYPEIEKSKAANAAPCSFLFGI